MSGTVLENLSGKKLSVLVFCFLLCQVACFLIGGLIGKLYYITFDKSSFMHMSAIVNFLFPLFFLH